MLWGLGCEGSAAGGGTWTARPMNSRSRCVSRLLIRSATRPCLLGHPYSVTDGRGSKTHSNKLTSLYRKTGPAVLLLFGLLWLFLAVTNLVADPGRWGYYFVLVLGMFAVVAAFHPMARTPLSWSSPKLRDDERVLVQERASWVAGISRGGTLVVTTRRVIFEPNSIEATLRLRRRTWEWSAVRAAEVAPRGLNLAGGALRRRLRLLITDGSSELFVVHRPEELKDRLTSLIAQ